MKILNFGSCNIDYVYTLSHIVCPGETTESDFLAKFPGGKGLNQSIALAKSGMQIFHAGCIGKDGDFLKDILLSSGVDIRFLKTVDAQTGHAIIQVDNNGENSIILYHGTNYCVDKSYIDSVLAEFKRNDYLILQNEINNIDYLIAKGYEKKMKIVFNPSPFADSLKNINLNRIYLLILNEIEAYGYTKEKEPSKIADYFIENYPDLKVVLTLGENGSVYIDKNHFEYCSAFNVEVQDTTAAGDTLTGYLVSGMIQGMNIKQSLVYASAAAAIAVSKNGAASSIPHNNEVVSAMKSLKMRNMADRNIEIEKEKVETYLNNNSKASLNDLSKLLGYSACHTGAWIKKRFGKSFSELQLLLRCKKAADLLKNTNIPITEIIQSCGYKNESFFRKKFKECYTCTPYKYRKLFRGEKGND